MSQEREGMKNTIIASPAFAKFILSKNYKKKLIFDTSAPNDRWFYFSKRGKFRTVINNEIWTSIYRDNYPTGYIVKIRGHKK